MQPALEALRRGQNAKFTFDLLLAKGIATSLLMGQVRCELDRYGRAALFLGAQKVAEIGLAHTGKQVRWLSESAQPAEDSRPQADPNVLRASSEVMIGKALIRLDVKITRLPGGIAMAFRRRPRGKDAAKTPLTLTVAVPASVVAGLPKIAATEKAEPKGDTQVSARSRGYRASVTIKNGGTLNWSSATAWSVRTASLAGAKCHVLTAALSELDAGAYEARIRLVVAKPKQPDSKRVKP